MHFQAVGLLRDGLGDPSVCHADPPLPAGTAALSGRKQHEGGRRGAVSPGNAGTPRCCRAQAAACKLLGLHCFDLSR